jgi:hypothetical protein
VARILLLGGGCRGRQLAGELLGAGHAVRITTRSEGGREAIERVGAECWVGTPDRLATLRGALDGVTVACWLLATAGGTPEQLSELYGSRLEFFLTQAIDTTVRGILYESSTARQEPDTVRAGAALARRICELNQIPLQCLRVDPADGPAWAAAAAAAIDLLLGL